MKVLIAIPAFNEAPVIQSTLKQVAKAVKKIKAELVVIDDGSKDKTADQVKDLGYSVLRHRLNRGLGGAIGTGLEYAKRNGFDYLVTLDADGQHHPKDIAAILEPLKNKQADVVIGSRFMGDLTNMPIDRQVLLSLSNLLTWVLFGQKTTDSLSGFRGFNRRAIERIRIKTNQMEVSNEFFSEIKRLKLKLKEVPIEVIYTDYSRAKGQTNSNAINIVWKLFLRLFR